MVENAEPAVAVGQTLRGKLAVAELAEQVMLRVTRVLGGGKKMMLGNLIELQFGAGRNWPLGAALSITLLSIVMIALLVYLLRKPIKKGLAGRREGIEKALADAKQANLNRAARKVTLADTYQSRRSWRRAIRYFRRAWVVATRHLR